MKRAYCFLFLITLFPPYFVVARDVPLDFVFCIDVSLSTVDFNKQQSVNFLHTFLRDFENENHVGRHFKTTFVLFAGHQASFKRLLLQEDIFPNSTDIIDSIRNYQQNLSTADRNITNFIELKRYLEENLLPKLKSRKDGRLVFLLYSDGIPDENSSDWRDDNSLYPPLLATFDNRLKLVNGNWEKFSRFVLVHQNTLVPNLYGGQRRLTVNQIKKQVRDKWKTANHSYRMEYVADFGQPGQKSRNIIEWASAKVDIKFYAKLLPPDFHSKRFEVKYSIHSSIDTNYYNPPIKAFFLSEFENNQISNEDMPKLTFLNERLIFDINDNYKQNSIAIKIKNAGGGFDFPINPLLFNMPLYIYPYSASQDTSIIEHLFGKTRIPLTICTNNFIKCEFFNYCPVFSNDTLKIKVRFSRLGNNYNDSVHVQFNTCPLNCQIKSGTLFYSLDQDAKPCDTNLVIIPNYSQNIRKSSVNYNCFVQIGESDEFTELDNFLFYKDIKIFGMHLFYISLRMSEKYLRFTGLNFTSWKILFIICIIFGFMLSKNYGISAAIFYELSEKILYEQDIHNPWSFYKTERKSRIASKEWFKSFKISNGYIPYLIIAISGFFIIFLELFEIADFSQDFVKLFILKFRWYTSVAIVSLFYGLTMVFVNRMRIKNTLKANRFLFLVLQFGGSIASITGFNFLPLWMGKVGLILSLILLVALAYTTAIFIVKPLKYLRKTKTLYNFREGDYDS